MIPVTSEIRSVIANASPGPRLRSLPPAGAASAAMMSLDCHSPTTLADPDRDQALEQAVAELAQVVDERHHLAVPGGRGRDGAGLPGCGGRSWAAPSRRASASVMRWASEA